MKKIKIFLCLLIAVMAYVINVNYVKADEVKLKSFNLKTTDLFLKEKMYYEMDYEGNPTFVGLWAKEIHSGDPFYINTQNLNNGYFDLATPNGNLNYFAGTYQVTGVTLGTKDGIAYYSTDCNEAESTSCIKYDFSGLSFVLKSKEPEPTNELPIFDYVLTMDYQQAYVGDKVNVNFGSPESFDGVEIDEKPVSNVMLSFTNQNDNSVLNVYLNSLDKNPYFVVPSNATVGKYNINFGYLTFTDGTSEKYQNRPGKVFSYDGSFEIMEKEFDKTKYSFNSENYDSLVKNDLQKLNNDAIITVNANNSPIVYKELFETIKSTNRTLIIDYQNLRWTFSGKDIENPKTLEVSVKLDEFKSNDLKDLIKTKSALLEFTNNGELPGKTLIKIDSKDLEKYFDSDVIYVYYYDETEKDILKVAMEVRKNNGFFEFYINHNSKYIITSKEITEVKSVKTDSILKENNKEIDSKKDNIFNHKNILFASIGVLSIIIIITVVVVAKKKKKAKKVINEEKINNNVK